MKTWFTQKDPREKKIIVIGMIGIVTLGIFQFIYRPIQMSAQRNEEAVIRLSQDLALMQMQRQLIVKNQSKQKMTVFTPQNLLSKIEQSYQNSNIGGNLEQIERINTQQIRLSLKAIAFNPFLRWMDTLFAQSIQLVSLQVTPADQDHVNVTLILSL